MSSIHKPTRTRDQYMDYLFSCFFCEAPGGGKNLESSLKKMLSKFLCVQNIFNVRQVLLACQLIAYSPFYYRNGAFEYQIHQRHVALLV